MRDLAVAFRAQAFDDDKVLRVFEMTVFAAMFENAIRNGLADMWQAHQLFGGGSVEIDAFLGVNGRK